MHALNTHSHELCNIVHIVYRMEVIIHVASKIIHTNEHERLFIGKYPNINFGE